MTRTARRSRRARGKAETSASATRGLGSFQTIWGQPEPYVDTYYAKYNRNKDSKDWRDWPYFAGDGAMQGADRDFRILGRVDDAINVAGIAGTKEIESASITVAEIAEAAAVPVIEELRGKVVEVMSRQAGVPQQGDRAKGVRCDR